MTVQDQIASSRYTPASDAEPKTRPIHVNVKLFQGKEGKNLQFCMREVEMAMREVEMAMRSAMLH